MLCCPLDMVALPARDPLVRISLAALALQALLLVILPVGPRAAIAHCSDACLVAVTALAAFRAYRADPGLNQRRFWLLVAAGAIVWLVAVLIDVAPLRASREAFYLATDCLYLAVYFAFILAVGMRPDQPSYRAPLAWAIVLEWVGDVVFAFALLAYFVVVPFEVNRSGYVTLVSSLSAFVLLDAFLVWRFAWWARSIPGGRWSHVYGLLAGCFVLALAHDLQELSAYIQGVESRGGSPWDLVWTGQFVALIAAASAARQPDQETRTGRADDDAGRTRILVSPLVPFAFALPLIHLTGRMAGLLDPVAESARGILVLSGTLVLGGLAIAHQALLERRHQHVRHDLMLTQEQLQQARKMEALGRLARGVSHDFNNLLSVILGYSEMLLDRRGQDDRTTEPVREIQQAAERAVTLTRRLMTFSQRQLAEATVFELDDEVLTLEPVLQRIAGGHVVLAPSYGAPGRCLSADRHQFERALINVVANAHDAMPEGGLLRLSTGGVQLSEDEVRRPSWLAPGSYLQLSVGDSGSGMTAEVRSQIFEPFFTTRPRKEHPGLGLSVVYGIVTQAGGHIEVESEPGRGTTLRFLFPEVPRPAEAATPAGAAPGHEPGAATVLVAEDERALRQLMRVRLEREGYLVLEAADGRVALDVAARHEGRIDVLVTDIMMPGLDGRRLADRLRPERPEMRVLFVSAYAGDLLTDLDFSSEGPVFLQKPFTMSVLAARVAELVATVPSA